MNDFGVFNPVFE